MILHFAVAPVASLASTFPANDLTCATAFSAVASMALIMGLRVQIGAIGAIGATRDCMVQGLALIVRPHHQPAIPATPSADRTPGASARRHRCDRLRARA